MNLDQLRTQAFCERSTPADQRRRYQGTSSSPTFQVPKASASAKPPSSLPHGLVALIASGSEPCSQVFAWLRSPASRVEITPSTTSVRLPWESRGYFAIRARSPMMSLYMSVPRARIAAISRLLWLVSSPRYNQS